MANIEFKAELLEIDLARTQCRTLGAQHVETIRQVDTYYRTATGRIKQRSVEGREMQWIAYERPNTPGPRISRYTILNDEQARIRWGEMDWPEWVTVCKTREVWTDDNMRIHLDTVDELGVFIEIEAVVDEQHNEQSCRAAIASLREQFRPILGEAVPQSYSDLVATGVSSPPDRQ